MIDEDTDLYSLPKDAGGIADVYLLFGKKNFNQFRDPERREHYLNTRMPLLQASFAFRHPKLFHALLVGHRKWSFSPLPATGEVFPRAQVSMFRDITFQGKGFGDFELCSRMPSVPGCRKYGDIPGVLIPVDCSFRYQTIAFEGGIIQIPLLFMHGLPWS